VRVHSFQAMSITLNTVCAPSNGARFQTADLHVHSFGGSSDVTDAAMTVGNIIETAAKGSTAILAITDRNSVQESTTSARPSCCPV
jgi:hypothetical protein